MKKILLLTVLPLVLVACGDNDEYAKYRKLTTSDFMDDSSLRNEVIEICDSGKITSSQAEDFEICLRARKAHSDYHNPW